MDSRGEGASDRANTIAVRNALLETGLINQ